MRTTLIRLLSFTLMISVIACNNTNENEPIENSNTQINNDKKLVSVEIVKNDVFSNQTITNGVLHAKDKISLAFKKNSILTKVYTQNGQFVRKNQLLAQIENNDESLAVEKAKESLKNAELELNSLMLGFGGISGDTNSVNSNLLSNLKTQSGYTIALINLKSAKYNLNRTYLRSPISGIIADQNSKVFDLINSNEIFCKIINNKIIIAEFNIMEQELPSIRIGQTIKVIPIAYDSITLIGEVTNINPIVDKNGFIKTQAEVSNPYYRTNSNTQLMDGMNIRIIIESHQANSISVPKSALVLRSNKKVIFTYKNGRAKWNYVESSSENTTHYLITNGLQYGDTIITKGNIHLAHDVVVQISPI